MYAAIPLHRMGFLLPGPGLTVPFPKQETYLANAEVISRTQVNATKKSINFRPYLCLDSLEPDALVCTTPKTPI